LYIWHTTRTSNFIFYTPQKVNCKLGKPYELILRFSIFFLLRVTHVIILFVLIWTLTEYVKYFDYND